MPIVGLADRLAQAVRHERAGRDDALHHAFIDHLRDDLPHLGDGHRTGQRHHDLALWVCDHRREHLEGLPHMPSAEGRLPHGLEQLTERRNLVGIQRLKRL